jgi:hypothetical protein
MAGTAEIEGKEGLTVVPSKRATVFLPLAERNSAI